MSDRCTQSKSYAIPMHRPDVDAADVAAVVAALQSGLWTGDGDANRELAETARETLGCTHAFPTPSGTHALELMFRALPLTRGDEVICPSFTFV